MGHSTADGCPSSSSSSSEFEFTVSLSPASKQRAASQLCPADELFYKGQLLPLQLSPRISMVRNLLLSSASASSGSGSGSGSDSSAARDSTGSSSSSVSADCVLFTLPPADSCASSSRPSSVAEDERPVAASRRGATGSGGAKYFSSFATRFSSVFRKKEAATGVENGAERRPPKSLAKEVIKKYAKKVKPLYEKLSSLPQQQHQKQGKKTFFSILKKREPIGAVVVGGSFAGRRSADDDGFKYSHSNSFSGNLRFPRQRPGNAAASCPSSMRSSPSHSGLLYVGGAGGAGFPDMPTSAASTLSTASSMEELQSAIEGAIAHCKSSMSVAACHRKAASGGGEIRVC